MITNYFSVICFPFKLLFNWTAVHVEWVQDVQPLIEFGQANANTADGSALGRGPCFPLHALH